MRKYINADRVRSAVLMLGDAGLAVAALFNTALLVVLVLTLSVIQGRAETATAQADAQQTCTGANLLSTLKNDNPEAFAEAMAEAEKTENGRGLLWKIQKPGVTPSFLFGTMHVTDPRVTELSPLAKAALDGAQTVVIESTDVLDAGKVQLALLAKPELTMFTDGTTLASLIEPDDLKLVEAELKRRGIPLTLVSRMKPWLISGLVALPDCEMSRKAAGVDFLDKKLAVDAMAQGKTVLGLETMEEQLSAMADLPVEFHVKGLVETIKLGEIMPDVIATMTDLYLSEDIAMIMPIIRAAGPQADISGGEESDDGYAEFEERIIHMRNHVMAERAAPILEEGGAFIAVGALHLPGEEGLVRLLRDAGYTVTAAN